MEIRRAAIEDAGELTRVAHESKSHWGYPRRWIELWRDDLTITPEFITAMTLDIDRASIWSWVT